MSDRRAIDQSRPPADRLLGMIELTADEARVLGVLIEKAFTTPEQYPLSINAITNGANQKSNRDPVLSLTEDQAHDAVERLREKQLAVRVDSVGSRVHKYKHQAGETLHCRAGELAILAELLLRGPQTIGELRGRAARMSPLATLDDAKAMLRALMDRPEPFVKEIAPSPGSRAERFLQLLCLDAHPATETSTAVAPSNSPAKDGLAERVSRLEDEVASLRMIVERLKAAAGESNSADSA